MKRFIVALLILLLPSCFAVLILRLMRFRVGQRVRFGFSVILTNQLSLGDDCSIGHFNYINTSRFLCDKAVRVGRQNVLSGAVVIRLLEYASIGNRNKVLRSWNPAVVSWGAQFRLERWARITSDHLIDCTRSVHIGEYSILAGSGSQLWTHGYIHDQHGAGRYRLDGLIGIGNNVYVGSRCIINLGVNISPGCSIGAGTVISKSLINPGFYVSAPVRYLPVPIDPSKRVGLRKEKDEILCEPVFFKE